MQDQTTLMLQRLADGDRAVMSELMPRVYEELRSIANRHLAAADKPDVLQATGLVHEAYLKLIDQGTARFADRSHFLAIASMLMRRVLVDHVRSQRAAKRGGNQANLQLDTFCELGNTSHPVDLLVFDEVLDGLKELNPRHAQVVEMRFFGGLTIQETAVALEVSPATIKSDWRSARAWLAVEMKG